MATPHYSTSIADRAAGVLWGLAAGDRNGGPLAMACVLVEGVLARGRFDVRAIRKGYQRWYEAEGFDTGPVAATVFELRRGGFSSSAAVARAHELHDGKTAGCNPAHRFGPVAACSLDDDALLSAARVEAALTHRDRLAGEVSAATAGLARALLRGLSWDDARRRVAARVGAEVASLFDESEPKLSGYAPDVLATACHFLSRGTCARSALEAALQHGGPANYAPVLVGLLAGARWGANALGAVRVHARTKPEQVSLLAERLARCWT